MRVPLLDHGYVELVESWGSDERIIEAARMSTGKGFKGWGTVEAPGDEKLLRYLWEHKHGTPFEMGGVVVEVKAPIFVFREWHRHRTQSYNEMSGRYVPLPDENYVPTVERLLMTGGKNKQASGVGGVVLNVAGALVAQKALRASYDEQQQLYQDMLEMGVPKELARIHLPVGRYSRMRASANLRNWLAFIQLRADETAMWEIREYAVAVREMLRGVFPRTVELACKVG